MDRLVKNFKKLKEELQQDNHFSCGLVVVDYYEQINWLKENLNEDVIFIDNFNSIKDIDNVKNRVINGEKIILSSLDKLYYIFSVLDIEYNDGIYWFYHSFTNSYREQLCQNNQGQIYFVLTKDEYNKFYTPALSRDINFKKMLPLEIDLTKNGRFKEIDPVEHYSIMAKNMEYRYIKMKEKKK